MTDRIADITNAHNEKEIMAAAAAIANARGMRRGAPIVGNVLDMLRASPRFGHLYLEVIEDATAALIAARAADDTGGMVAELAAGLREPGREEETSRHHRAILAALNASHKDGVQDTLTVFEALARLLATLVGGMGEAEARGVLTYVTWRALKHAPAARAAGAVADHGEEAPHKGPIQ